MNTQELHCNPFAQLMAPEALADALKQSAALAQLKSRICRPLDKPMLACFAALAEFDAEIDSLNDEILCDDAEIEIADFTDILTVPGDLY